MFLITFGSTVHGASLDESIEILRGVWGWGGCEDNKHSISSLPNKEFLEFEYGPDNYGYYYVAGLTKKGLKVVLQHEDRVDEKGNLVTWYIVFKGKDTYFWLRSDREENDLRGPIKRCKK